MTTLQGMLAQTIHEDRVRGYEDAARRHRYQARKATPIAEQLRSLFDRTLGSTARRAKAPTAARS
jgi:hypothetical protein